jgi:hypothetical protein
MNSYLEVNVNGTKQWYNENDKLHRLDGPAIEYADGGKSWWVNGERHRLDGPAVEWPNGDKEWWIEGNKYTEEQFKAKIETMSRPCKGKKIVVDGVEYTLS